MVRRKGLGSGKGQGYTNILGNDKSIHSQSAKGIKQPTSINESRLDSMDKLNFKRVPYGSPDTNLEDRDYKLTEDSPAGTRKEILQKYPNREINVTELDGSIETIQNDKKSFGTKTKELLEKGFSKTKEFTKQKLEERKEQQFESKAELLTEVKHPLTNKLNQQYDRVRTLEKHRNEATDEKNKEKLELKLKEEREQYREIQEEITKINVQDLSNAQLEQISIRYKDESFFGFGDTNPYRTELLRRTEFKKKLDKDIKDIKQKPIIKEEGLFEGLFD